MKTLCLSLLLFLLLGAMNRIHSAENDAAGGKKPKSRISVDHENMVLAPYAWKRFGTGADARAEATVPGAYLKIIVQHSAELSLLVDGEANNGCPATSMPVIDFSVDGGAYKTVQLSKTGSVYALPLGENLKNDTPHRVDVYFRAANLGPERWKTSKVHLRIAGVEVDEAGTLLPCPKRAKSAIGFGDSITEGVCVEGMCPYYSNLLMNNARMTWLPIACAALDCEYGQIGSGGQGVLKPMSLPPLPESWDHYDAATSRLTNGLLLPEPDYVFCCMGTNDFQGDGNDRKQLDIAPAYIAWLVSMRKACPNAMLFCITPPLGWHVAEIAAAVAARQTAGDPKVFLIDTAPLKSGYAASSATQFAPDGVHPSIYGNAILGALVAVEAQKIISKSEARR